ncbi:MAG: CDP-alcohol phosphatidyltransferase family protein [Christensenellales bacterium]
MDYWALGAFLPASATDMLDGFLARRMQCITDFGKLMDPLADKLMVLSVLFTLLIRGIIPWEPVALLGGKELLMLIGGACLYNRKIVVHSLSVGKFAQVAVSMALILSFFHCRFEQLALPLHIILLWDRREGVAYTALVVYVRSVVRQLRGVENTYNERK